nr:MarR family transcriptional regulator [Nakamurella panacisegetis]
MAPTLTSEQLTDFFDNLVRCETRLYNALGDRLRAEHGITTSQFEFLRYLAAHPDSRVGDIAANFAVGIGAISKVMDRLETAGWAIRVPNPSDRRSSLISLSARGAALLTEAEPTFGQCLRELVSGVVRADQIDAAAGVLATLRRSLEAARVGLPTG